MRNDLGRIVVLATSSLLLLAVVGGCGGGPPAVDTSTTEATVSGKVTVRGEPAAGQTISFDPSNVQRKTELARSTETGDDGSYTVTTLLGQNQVTFSGSMFQDADLQYESISFDVQRGENTLDIDLPTGSNTGP